MQYGINGVIYTDRQNIKEGNISGACSVIIIDGSYTMSITKENELKNMHGIDFRHPNDHELYEVLKVIAVNVSVPTNYKPLEEFAAYQNNIILRRQNGDLIFASKINLGLIDCPQIDF